MAPPPPVRRTRPVWEQRTVRAVSYVVRWPINYRSGLIVNGFAQSARSWVYREKLCIAHW